MFMHPKFSLRACSQNVSVCLRVQTNHLDIETIDSLAEGINAWDGGLCLVSHDFRLIGQVAKEIWEVRDGGVHIWPDDITSYKKHLAKKMAAM
jgi:ATP-binding cassette, subfamily F, member 2